MSHAHPLHTKHGCPRNAKQQRPPPYKCAGRTHKEFACESESDDGAAAVEALTCKSLSGRNDHILCKLETWRHLSQWSEAATAAGRVEALRARPIPLQSGARSPASGRRDFRCPRWGRLRLRATTRAPMCAFLTLGTLRPTTHPTPTPPRGFVIQNAARLTLLAREYRY